VFHTDTVILSVFVTDTSLDGQNVRIDLHATDLSGFEDRNINLEVIPDNHVFIDNGLAKEYRDTALTWLQHTYPGN
jgi:hypothetical protein